MRAGIEQLHKDMVIGSFDAAVIDQEDGKPHVVKRMDRPGIRVVPEWFGGGTLPRKELREAAKQLTAGQAGLIAVGEPTIEKALDKALTNADKVFKRTVDASADEITSELREALKLGIRPTAGTGIASASSSPDRKLDARSVRQIKTPPGTAR